MHETYLSPFIAVQAPHAITFAYKHLTPEGFFTICALLVVSVFSWTVIISKARQLIRAKKATRDPLQIFRKKEEYDGSPAYELYITGAEEIDYHLKNNPVEITEIKSRNNSSGTFAETDMLARSISTKVSRTSFETVQGALERAASTEALSLEKGMIILSTAVAGGPFIGLFGTVWGVMETFSGIGVAGAATLNAMAPGVAAAVLATVAGLSVAIPAMFAYNYMVTTIRAITQELDGFSAEYATALEHKYVDNRSMVDELREALKGSEIKSPSFLEPALTS